MIIHTQMYSIFSLLAKNAYIYIYRCKFKCIAIILDNKDNGKCKTCNIMKMVGCTWKYFRLTVQYFRPEIVTSVKVFFQKQTKLPCLWFFFFSCLVNAMIPLCMTSISPCLQCSLPLHFLNFSITFPIIPCWHPWQLMDSMTHHMIGEHTHH